MSPRKICFVGLENLSVLAPEYKDRGIGGEQVQQTLLARAFTKRGYDVCMVVADYGQVDGAKWAGIKTFKAYRPRAGLPVLRFAHPRWTGMWSALKRADADVYYTSCAGMQIGLVALFCRRHGKKMIFRIASDADCDPDRLLIRFARDKLLYEYGLKHADAVLAQSSYQKETLSHYYGMQSVLAGMLVEAPSSVFGFSSRDIPVLWVSTLRELKRPQLMLDLAEILPQLAMHMIGGRGAGSEALYDVVHLRAQTLPNISFHGQLPYQEVNVCYSRAKVFVCTSEIEGFPNSYLQSWVRGTPVVAFFDPDGVIERNGLGCAVRSLDEMRNVVRQFNSDRALWLKTSERCKAYMAREYGEDRILAPYVDMIEVLCGSREQVATL